MVGSMYLTHRGMVPYLKITTLMGHTAFETSTSLLSLVRSRIFYVEGAGPCSALRAAMTRKL